MKKILLIISIISVLFLAGCNNNKNVNNDVLENNGNQNQEEIKNNGDVYDDNSPNENLSQNAELTEEQLIEKYKISDSYVLKEEEVKDLNFNILNYSYNYETQRYEIVANNQEVISDGIEFKIECNMIDEEEYEIKINGEILEIDYGGSLVKVGEYNVVGIIDVDTLDEYKEIVIRNLYGVDSELRIYQLTSEGLKLIFQEICSMDVGLIIVNNNYIYPHENYIVLEVPVMGYYIYEDGEFKYINGFLTGEKITDEEGNFPENFKNEVFTAASEGAFHTFSNDNFLINGGTKLKLLKRNEKIDYGNYSDYTYDIELAEDTTVSVNNNGTWEDKVLPKGTILEDM